MIFLIFHVHHYVCLWVGIAQSVQRLATGLTVWGSNLSEGQIFRSRPDGPWGLLSLLYNEYRVFTRDKFGRGWP
jgi:hypothetical protein